MDRSNRLAPAVALALLLAAPAVDATPLQGTIAAGSIGATSPNALQAPLVAFVQPRDLKDDRSDPSTILAAGNVPPDPWFSLDARSIRVVTHSADPTVNYLDANGKPEASEQTYENASATGLGNRPTYVWSLFPLRPGAASVEATSTCSGLGPSQETTVKRASNVGFSGPDNSVESRVSDALEWTDCSGSGSLTVRGDFLLMLWEWDVLLRAGGRDQIIHSGRTRMDQDPGDPTGTFETQNFVSKDWQRYLYVQEGALTIPAPREGSYGLYVGPGARLQALQILLEGAEGRLAVGGQAIDLHSSAAQLQGDLVLDASGTGVGRPILGHLEGDVRGASLDGTPLSLDTQGANPFSPDARLLGAAAGVLLLALGVSCALGGRRPAATLAVACSRGAYAFGFRRLASGWADLAARLDPHLPAARLARARALTALLRYEEALEDHASLDRLLTGRSQRARNAVEAARTLAAMDRARDALAWLFRARQCDTEVFYPAVGDPDFRCLRAEPWFLVQLQDRAYRGGFPPMDCYSRRRAGNAQSFGLGDDTSASLP